MDSVITDNNIISHPLEPMTSPIDKSVNRYSINGFSENVQFKKTLSYLNNLPCEVVIKEKSNLAYPLPPSGLSSMEKSLFIQLEITFSSSVRKRVEQQIVLCGDKEKDNHHYNVIKKALQDSPVNTYGPTKLILNFSIDYKTISEKGGTIYLPEIDTLISLKEANQVDDHPYSGRAILNHLTKNEGTGFTYQITVNDPDNEMFTLFTNFNGIISTIEPSRIPEIKKGIYIKYSNIDDGIKKETNKTIHYEFDEINKLNIYATRSEARASINNNVEQEIRLKEMEKELAEEKIKLQQEKARLDAESLEREHDIRKKEAKIKELEREEELRYSRIKRAEELEEQKRKSEYEHRSMSRKEESEVIKNVPAIIIGIAAIFTFFGKLFS